MGIPKKIHQVWIGDESIPNKWKRCCNQVKDAHPDWEYKLWLNQDVQEIIKKSPPNVVAAYERFYNKKIWALACDVLRYSLLYQKGGVYMDCDFIMTKDGSLNQLPLEKNLILLNMRYNTPEKPKYRIQNCFMACNQENKFIERVLNRIDNIEYQLTTLKGEPIDKFNTQYLTNEYNIYLGRPYNAPDGMHAIKKDIEKFIPADETIIKRNYFLGDDALIARHLYALSHRPVVVQKNT